MRFWDQSIFVVFLTTSASERGGGGSPSFTLWLDPCHTYTINTHTDIKTNHITPARLCAVGVTRLIAIRKQNHSSFAFPTLTSTAAASTRELSATIPTSHTHFNSCSIHQRTQHHHTNLHITWQSHDPFKSLLHCVPIELCTTLWLASVLLQLCMMNSISSLHWLWPSSCLAIVLTCK